jgi:hypothetical protein
MYRQYPVLGRELARLSWVAAAALVLAVWWWWVLLQVIYIQSFLLTLGLVSFFAMLTWITLVYFFYMRVACWLIAVPSGQFWLVYNPGQVVHRVLSGGHAHWLRPCQSVVCLRDNTPVEFRLYYDDPNAFPAIRTQDNYQFKAYGTISFVFDPVRWFETELALAHEQQRQIKAAQANDQVFSGAPTLTAEEQDMLYHRTLARLLPMDNRQIMEEVKRHVHRILQSTLAEYLISDTQVWSNVLRGLHAQLKSYFLLRLQKDVSDLEWMVQIEPTTDYDKANNVRLAARLLHEEISGQEDILLTAAEQGRWQIRFTDHRGKLPPGGGKVVAQAVKDSDKRVPVKPKPTPPPLPAPGPAPVPTPPPAAPVTTPASTRRQRGDDGEEGSIWAGTAPEEETSPAESSTQPTSGTTPSSMPTKPPTNPALPKYRRHDRDDENESPFRR